MNQLNLFQDDRYQPARKSDPATSHQAADEVRPKIGKLQRGMLAVFARGGAYTANEAAQIAAKGVGGMAESYRKRAKELVVAGRIYEAGTKHCTVTGQQATAYRATK